MSTRGFLAAEWRNIALLNYPAHPSLLTPLLPSCVELDLWKDQAYISVVGLLFEHLAFCGIPVPVYRRFEQVNLRFYVRRPVGSGWRRGVVFVKEFVPHRLLAAAARVLYNQNYEFARMSRRFDAANPAFGDQPSDWLASDPQDSSIGSGAQSSGGPWTGLPPPETVEYTWWRSGRWHRLGLKTKGPWQSVREETFEHFIAERHWGYTGMASGRTMEFEVRRPAWLVSPADGWLDCDAGNCYGEPFADLLSRGPASAFVAAGSTVRLLKGIRLSAK
jgi:hypothetical protein